MVTEQCILQNEVIENTSDREEQPLNPRQRYAQWKQLLLVIVKFMILSLL